MKITRLALAAVLLASAFPVHAQVVVAPRDGTTVAPAEKPEATCPCDNSNFKPLNDKARAAAEYWDARRKYKIASTLAGTMALFALLTRDGGTMNEAQQGLSRSASELNSARSKAVRLEAIKVTGDDDKTLEILIKKGVDYTLAP